ncbi:hypothetical protein D0C16_07785 [Cellvibrio sp. KY-GH-1]|uniref:NACHT domain-containing protein n=1 Tax=Cellvibrio sp. KY-GH-1 TaxID=2303332 RepID=UPI001247E806|nr:hypothetical protein [Cellvibrio sp. KY-GH-1]QEY15880.1 hypothetical protein D0C16_07785 [Cellvibrio sp. KY-GH-1]
MINQIELKKIYSQYGFEEQPSGAEGVYVYTLHSGHFHNADIVPIKKDANEESVFKQYKEAGYACKIRKYSSLEEVESALFKGFFTVESTKQRLMREYEKFTSSIIAAYPNNATYSYIKSGYYIEKSPGEKDVITEVISKLEEKKPTLFLIEAAAGFGKTCTAFEILKSILNRYDSKIPLFTELARNRGAKIFRYVLLDEIDRSFPSLSSKLVRTEIQNGNVPVILDGFDELLHRRDDGETYENAEPMLETIGELLSKNAKVILTTRRTAIFDGDEFHEWIESHGDDFEIVRIRINEPTVTEWLPQNRLMLLHEKEFPIETLSNPVLLSYLRFIDEDAFDNAINDPDSIVEKYFTTMFEREQIRQDIHLKPSEQYQILKSIAKDMTEKNYTAESREYLSGVIQNNHLAVLEESRKTYIAEQRPTIDELLNKLTGHALLDRESDEKQGIGFVNDFVLGNFCADTILEDTSGEWIGDLRFIEPSILAYNSRSKRKKLDLWNAIKFSLEFAEASEKIESAIKLTDEINIEIKNETISDISISNIAIAKNHKIENTTFINCTFNNVQFVESNIQSVNFVGCSFFNCESHETTDDRKFYFSGCQDNNEFIKLTPEENKLDENHAFTEEEIYILEKFWPVGRQTFIKHRPIKGICSHTNKYTQEEILRAMESLRKQEILTTPVKSSFLELNIMKIAEVKSALGKNNNV